ncbi:hypothetical protein ACFL6G_07600 [candidate division KSB1 bacterium]
MELMPASDFVWYYYDPEKRNFTFNWGIGFDLKLLDSFNHELRIELDNLVIPNNGHMDYIMNFRLGLVFNIVR